MPTDSTDGPDVAPPPIHDPACGRPLRLVGFFSGGASSLRALMDAPPGARYEVVGALTDTRAARALPTLRERLGADRVRVNDYAEFYADHDLPRERLWLPDGDFNPRALASREQFDRQSLALVADLDPDLLVFSGYMKIITRVLYERHVILNVHPADLARLDARGDRAYTGDDAVYDAVAAGEPAVRATIHVVTGAVDGGPTVGRSPPLPVPAFHRVAPGSAEVELEASGDRTTLRALADALQETLKTRGDAVIFQDVVEKVAAGRIAVARAADGQVTAVYLDGRRLDYHAGYALAATPGS